MMELIIMLLDESPVALFCTMFMFVGTGAFLCHLFILYSDEKNNTSGGTRQLKSIVESGAYSLIGLTYWATKVF